MENIVIYILSIGVTACIAWYVVSLLVRNELIRELGRTWVICETVLALCMLYKVAGSEHEVMTLVVEEAAFIVNIAVILLVDGMFRIAGILKKRWRCRYAVNRKD